MSCRTLLSAQDAGAATQMLALADILNRNGAFEVFVYAADPAHRLFERAGLRHEYVAPQTSESWLTRAATAVNGFCPDIVVVGLSSIDHNIDTAFLAAQQRRGGIDAMLLDDRGPLQAMSGRVPALLLAVNDPIKRWAEMHCHAPAANIGSPKAAAWRHLPLTGMRRQARQQLGLSDADIALIYSLQTSSLPGHDESFASFVEAFADTSRGDGRVVLILRGHPAHPATRKAAGKLLRDSAVPFLDGDGMETVALLAAGDGVATCNSTLAEDFQIIAGIMRRRGLALYLALSAELRKWYVAKYDDTAPAASSGASARLLEDRDSLVAALRELQRGAGIVTLPPDEVDPEIAIPEILLEVAKRG